MDNIKCTLDCYCHTGRSRAFNKKQFGADELLPAIDCCKHCCLEWEEHNDPNNDSLLGRMKRGEIKIWGCPHDPTGEAEKRGIVCKICEKDE